MRKARRMPNVGGTLIVATKLAEITTLLFLIHYVILALQVEKRMNVLFLIFLCIASPISYL
jgi:hypothetical protein